MLVSGLGGFRRHHKGNTEGGRAGQGGRAGLVVRPPEPAGTAWGRALAMPCPDGTGKVR